jgi:hypothetical protein
MSRLEVKVTGNQVQFYDPENESNKTSISFQRTLRLPEDGKVYPLPPSLGTFPVCRVDDYLDKVPEEWKKTGGVFLPMYQREAMWLKFDVQNHKAPKAIKVAVGKVNAVTGETWNNSLSKQDYVVAGDNLQQWLDGINGGDGIIKQFVAMPLGGGYTVEAQVTGEEKFGGIQLMVFESKNKPQKEIRRSRLTSAPMAQSDCAIQAPILPSVAPQPPVVRMCKFKAPTRIEHVNIQKKHDIFNFEQEECESRSVLREEAKEMGISAGGKMKQKIIQDPFGVDHWDTQCFGRCFVHIVNSAMYQQITGKAPPSTPISAKTYSSYGYKWYDMYEENVGGVQGSSILDNVKTVKEIDQEKFAFSQQDDSTVFINANQVQKIPNKNAVRDGDW